MPTLDSRTTPLRFAHYALRRTEAVQTATPFGAPEGVRAGVFDFRGNDIRFGVTPANRASHPEGEAGVQA